MLELVFGILDLLLIISYFFWDTLKIYESWEVAYEMFTVFQFSLLITYLLARSYRDRSRVEGVGKELKSEILSLQRQVFNNSAALRQDEFYAEFRQQISRASSSIDMTHLDTRLPDDAALKGSEMKRYYDELIRIIRGRPTIHFRRVERVSPAKREWIEQLVQEMSGKTHCSLGCLVTDAADRKIPTISVQLVDGKRTYLVAIKQHNDSNDPRDIRIADEPCAELWQGYYNEMLWSPSIKVIENGIVHQRNWAEIQKQLSLQPHV